LVVMAGGDSADLDRAEPILKVFGSVRHCGALGTGAALKVVVIGAMINGVAVVAESLALADALGLPEEVAVDALQAGPMGGAVRRARDKSASYAVALAAKDLGLALQARPLPITEATRERLQTTDQSADLSALADPQNR
jgi:3-hydroxyisobutyrate dehydrogenase-like beta-hydroxyacid dehydrogenase